MSKPVFIVSLLVLAISIKTQIDVISLKNDAYTLENVGDHSSLTTKSSSNDYGVNEGRSEEKKRFDTLISQYQLANDDDVNRGKPLLYGSQGARITITEFADIECPFCKKVHNNVKKVVDHSEGAINWKFKHFPLKMHNPVAAIESQAIECVKQEYGNQTAWMTLELMFSESKGGGQGVQDIPSLVRSIGLSGALIQGCLESDDHKDRINSDFANGLELGINSTPAFVLVDNQTGRQKLVRGYQTPEQLLSHISSLF